MEQKQTINSKKTFLDWTRDDLFLSFGLTQIHTHPTLDNWLGAKNTITETEQKFLTLKRTKAAKSIDYWNEAELRSKFIDHIVEMVDFDAPEYFVASFSERKLSAIVNDVPLRGVVDWLAALGQSHPQIPFFFIHEYKAEEGQIKDGRAQLLASMLAAQKLNGTPLQSSLFNPIPQPDPNMPIYGCYIVGRNWFFLILQARQYCISKAYDATEMEDLYQIVRILKAQKQMILARLTKVK